MHCVIRITAEKLAQFCVDPREMSGKKPAAKKPAAKSHDPFQQTALTFDKDKLKKDIVDMRPSAKASRTKETKKAKDAKEKATKTEWMMSDKFERSAVDGDAFKNFVKLPTLEKGGVHGGRGYLAQLLNAVIYWLRLPPSSEGFVALEQTEDLAIFLKRAADPRVPVEWLRQLKDTTNDKEAFTLSGSAGQKYFKNCLHLLRTNAFGGRPFRFLLCTSGIAMKSTSKLFSTLLVDDWKCLVDPSGLSEQQLETAVKKALTIRECCASSVSFVLM
jgi:hypothetical protein